MRISIYQLKPRFQQLLQPALKLLADAGVSPNVLTLATSGLMVLYGAALALYPNNSTLWIALPLVMLLRMAFNALDGMLANSTGQKTRLGAVLNELGDQVSDAALYLPFAFAAGVHAGLLVLVVTAASWAEFAGIGALAANMARRFDGPMGKSDRAAAFGLLGLMVGFAASPLWINGLLVVVLILLAWTIANRLRAVAHA